MRPWSIARTLVPIPPVGIRSHSGTRCGPATVGGRVARTYARWMVPVLKVSEVTKVLSPRRGASPADRGAAGSEPRGRAWGAGRTGRRERLGQERADEDRRRPPRPRRRRGRARGGSATARRNRSSGRSSRSPSISGCSPRRTSCRGRGEATVRLLEELQFARYAAIAWRSSRAGHGRSSTSHWR